MSRSFVALPSLTLTSSAVDTSTQSVTAVDIFDASSLTVWVNGNTTAPGLQAQVSMAETSTGAFAPLLHESSGGSIVYLSSGARVIPHVAARWFRVGSSNVTSTGYTVVIGKHIEV